MPQASWNPVPPGLARRRLAESVSAAASGRGGVVVVRGGIGAGKSMLLAEAAGVRAISAAADHGSVVGLLQLALGSVLAAAPAEVAHAVAAIRWRLGLPGRPGAAPVLEDLDLGPALATVLPTLGPPPVIVALDGVDLTQPVAHRVLGHLAVALTGRPCLLLIVGSSTGLGQGGAGPTIAKVTTVDVGPLDHPSVADVLAQQLGRPASDDVIEGVLTATGGVARFVADAAAALADALPPRLSRSTLQDMARRLDHAHPRAGDLASLLAVAGPLAPHRLGVVAAAVGRQRIELEQGAASLLNSQVLVLDRGRLRIALPLLASGLATLVDEITTVLLHAALAEQLLADRAAGRPVHVEELARHLGWGPPRAEQTPAELLAVIEELLGSDSSGALALLNRISPLIDDGPDRGAALMLRARALLATGSTTEAHRDAMLAAEMGSATARDIAAAALARRRDTRGLVALAVGTTQSALPRAWAALELVLDDSVNEAEALATDESLVAAWLAFARGLGEDARRLVDTAADQRPNVFGAAVAWPAAEGLLCSFLGFVPAAKAALLAARRASAGEQADWEPWILVPQAVAHWQAGQWDRALDDTAAVRVFEPGLPVAYLADVIDLAIACARGEARRAHALATSLDGSDRPLLVWATAGIGLLGQPRPYREKVEAALLGTLEHGVLAWAPLLCSRLVELAVADSDGRAATYWARELRALAPSFATPWCSILAARTEAAALHRIDSAWEALDLATRHGMVVEALLARLELGRLGGPADEALAAFTGLRDLAAETWQRRALAVLRERRIPIPRSPRRATEKTTTALTELELELAVRAAEGATNAELAAIFSLSRRTVESRLSGAYRKLGCRSRLGLAAALTDRGLYR